MVPKQRLKKVFFLSLETATFKFTKSTHEDINIGFKLLFLSSVVVV